MIVTIGHHFFWNLGGDFNRLLANRAQLFTVIAFLAEVPSPDQFRIIVHRNLTVIAHDEALGSVHEHSFNVSEIDLVIFPMLSFHKFFTPSELDRKSTRLNSSH